MAKERLQNISLHQEMQRSYLEYAMSVIVGRALPDVRDGLKPVQRRILFAMHELGLTPDRPFRKCARVVGDVLGKYHPHGDQAVYEALVRLVQNFSSRYPILDGHGNFGSIDDDPPAAMRYTETRLSTISHEGLLEEISDDTVDFSPNFDGSQQEPDVLPAQLPFLILNGCTGIAVGMATNIPPHNLNEIVNATIALIKNPDISNEKLINFIPGPDFPTGGEILISNGIKETYIKGKGSIPMRGVCHIEEINPGKGKHKKSAIIITELPFQVTKSTWIEKLVDLINNNKIVGIADIRDESDREGMRVVIELKRDVSPIKIKEDLYKKTSLQSNFSATLLAIVNGQPKQLSLKQILINFIDYREQIITRRTKNQLNKAKEKIEILIALKKAIANLRLVIQTIENASDASEAKSKLIIQLDINSKQADGILSMALRKLTGMEKEGINKEYNELIIKSKYLENILSDRKELLNIMINELKSLKKQFSSKRKTKLIEGGDALIAERNANLRPNAELQKKKAFENLSKNSNLLIQFNGDVKIVSPKILNKLNLTDSCLLGDEPSPARIVWPIESYPKILTATNTGKIAILKWEFAGTHPGKLEKFLPSGLESEKVIDVIPIPSDKNINLGLLTTDGKFKRLSIEEVLELSGRAAKVLKLKENEFLQSTMLCKTNNYIMIITNIGRVLKLKITNEIAPIMRRIAQGTNLIKLFPGEVIVSSFSIIKENENENDLVLITNKGSVIKHYSKDIKENLKGDLGRTKISLSISKKDEERVVAGYLSNTLIGLVTNKKRHGRISATKMKEIDYNYLHKNVISLHADEYIESIVPLLEAHKS